MPDALRLPDAVYPPNETRAMTALAVRWTHGIRLTANRRPLL
jgi:hypothetical protein